jgi:DNA-binding response OmpR family regulator
MNDSEMTIEDAMSEFHGIYRGGAAIVAALTSANGRVLNYGQLQLAIEAASGNAVSYEAVRTAIRRARRVIVGRADIITARGVGYRIVWNEQPSP